MIVVNTEDCYLCKACERACPTEALKLNPLKVCMLCGNCVNACPNDALNLREIELNGKKIKQIEYNSSKCDLCGECVKVCPNNLTIKDDKLKGFCVGCMKCIDACPDKFVGMEGVVEPNKKEIIIPQEPIAVTDDCVGCGICAEECPVKAIEISDDKAVVDKDKCIYCSVCAQTCPWNAIFVAGKKSPKRDKNILKFEVNEECIGCGVCTDVCPKNLIKVEDMMAKPPVGCPACGLCANACPVDAITLEVEYKPPKPVSEEGIAWIEESCNYCGSCAMKCPTSAIKVVNKRGMELPTKKKTDEKEKFRMCVRCGVCTTVCPTGALKLGTVTYDGKEYNRIEFNPTLCNKCGECVKVCPYDMLELTENEKMPLSGFCVMCLKCVDACKKIKRNALALK